jgi:conjugative relaxase-like TrwC/TraI family protein
VNSSAKISGRHIRYYLNYVRAGGEPGRWLGRGAEALGLSGPVSEDDFLALAEGRRPGGEALVGQTPADRVPGWDFTFSAPKSVSLLGALHPDAGVRQAIRAAHDSAVSAAVGFLEDEGGRARRGKAGRGGQVRARLAVAGFVHPTSREQDPQLHTHAIVLNLGLGEDGRWSAIDSRALYRHRMAAGAVYRAELRQAMAGLGARWKRSDGRGLSEIDGLPTGLLRSFSRRRVSIEAVLAERGHSGGRAAQVACLDTRVRKVEAEYLALRGSWAARAEEHGFGPEELAGRLDGTDRQTPLGRSAREAVTDKLLGPEGLTARAAAFRRDDVIRAWAAALPQGATRSELEALVDETLARPEVVPLVVADEDGQVLTRSRRLGGRLARLVRAGRPATDHGQSADDALAEPRYTTAGMLALERGLVSWAEAGRSAGVAVAPREQVEPVLAARRSTGAGPGLTDEQAAMVRAVCGSGRALEVVVGGPGSGKTFALDAARQAWEAAGYRVLGAALPAEAAAVLGTGARVQSSTLDSLLGQLDRSGGLAPATVVLIDEAGMVDTRRLARLANHVRQAGAKLVLTGDDRQLPAIEAGGAFAYLARRVGATELVDNGRQVEAWERDALVDLRAGQVGQAAGAYERQGRMVVADRPEELLGVCVDRWWADRESGADAGLFAYSREATRILNALGRARMADAGRLSGPELVVGAVPSQDLAERAYSAGDEVVCLRNRRRLAGDPSGIGVRNGTRAVVLSAEPADDSLAVLTTDQRVLRLPGSYVRTHTDLGYALTVHRSQGKTLGQAARSSRTEVALEDIRCRGVAHVYGADGLSAEAALVATSRATDATWLYATTAPEPEPEQEVDPEPRAVAQAAAASWSRAAASPMATAELERAGFIARLSERSSPSELARRRAVLAEALGPGPTADPVGAREAAERRFADAVLDVDDARLVLEATARFGKSESRAEDELAARRGRASLAGAEQAATVAGAEADAAVATMRARRGVDVRAGREELEIVDAALARHHRRRLAELSADPPPWATEALGREPADRARFLRWRQGLEVIDDWRGSREPGSSRQPRPVTAVQDPLERALGPRPEGSSDGQAWDRASRAVHQARVDLGLEAADASEHSGEAAGATAETRLARLRFEAARLAERAAGREASRATADVEEEPPWREPPGHDRGLGR